MGSVVLIELYFLAVKREMSKGSLRIVSKVAEVKMALTCQLCSFLLRWAEKKFLIRH